LQTFAVKSRLGGMNPKVSQRRRRAMRIGIFTQTYLPTTNGVVSSIEIFRKTLEKAGHTFYIFAPKVGGYKDENPRVYRFPSITLPTHPDYPIAIPYFPGLTDLVKSLRLDIIHAQHIFTICGTGLRLAHRLKIPFVHTEHTLIAEYAHYMPLLHSSTRSYLIWRVRAFCNRSDRVIAPSPAMKQTLEEYGVEVPINVNPTGIDIGKYARVDDRAARERWQIDEKAKILMYVGRIAEEKNIGLLLKIFAHLSKTRNVHLLMIGSGPAEARYKAWVARNNLTDKVTWTGMLPHPEVIKLFGVAHVFLFPSVTDTQGIVVAEALAAGAPVVAANKMGPTAVIEDGKNGFLVPARSHSFIDRVETLLDNEKLWHRLSTAARIRAHDFSIERTAERLEEIYVDVRNRYRA